MDINKKMEVLKSTSEDTLESLLQEIESTLESKEHFEMLLKKLRPSEGEPLGLLYLDENGLYETVDVDFTIIELSVLVRAESLGKLQELISSKSL